MIPRRIGILGGTFDPIHCGHVETAAAAARALDLTAIFVVPTRVPPHRTQPFASAFHRFAMVAMAVAGRPRWRASDIELLAPQSPSFTSDTLRRFRDEGYAPQELFFIVGADAFLEIATWRDYPALLDSAHFAVVSRPGAATSQLRDRLPALAGRMTAPSLPSRTGPTLIFLIEAPTPDVSSTAIRQRIARGEAVAGMVPAGVLQHIEQHGLYRSTPAERRPAGTAPTPGAGMLHDEDRETSDAPSTPGTDRARRARGGGQESV
jgi:nicotinate-nucleotide adenylyltransferase